MTNKNPKLDWTEDRARRISAVAHARQLDVAIVLENVHDPHNIGAVLRTCDAVGIQKIFLIVTDDRVAKNLTIGFKSSTGARKWVDVYLYRDVKSCFEFLKSEYDQLIGTALSEESKSLYEFDFNKSTALVFGNEHAGLSNAALQYLDYNMIIPQYGMVQSLNISVACAISAYEVLRQRMNSGKYENPNPTEKKLALEEDFRNRHFTKHSGREINLPEN